MDCLEYIAVHLCTFVRSYAVHFIVHLNIHFEFNLEVERTDLTKKCSITFSVDLPQLAYSFVGDMSLLTNSP